MKSLVDGLGGGVFFVLFLLIYFPGGTILMATTCNARSLGGWDWVLSVIIPAFGLLKSLFSSDCIALLG